MSETSLLSFTNKLLQKGAFSCEHCNDLLVAPIMVVNIGNVCNTCYTEKRIECNWTGFENKPLEMVLNELHLPCKYQTMGCEELLPYKGIKQHEITCKHSTKLCPMFKLCNCTWEGNVVNFVDHFCQHHRDHVINSDGYVFSVPTTLSATKEQIKLLIKKNDSYVMRVQVNVKQNKLHYVLCNTINGKLFDYTIKLKGNNDNYIKTKSKVLMSDAIYQDFNEQVAVEVNIESLMSIAEVTDAFISVFKVLNDDQQQDGLDERLLHFFECPVCKCFMKPPIFQCQSGHSVCNVCRPRLEKCPTCRAIFGNIRNFSLEGLTSGVTYPCLYHDLGCPEKSCASGITKHESMCSFKPYSCPFTNCSLSGNHYTIKKHLMEFHTDKVMPPEVTEYKESFRMDQNSLYSQVIDRRCLVAFGHIFRLTCKRLSEYSFWAAEVVGAQNESKTFVYEVSIIDMRRPEKKLIRTDYCLQQISDDDLFKKCVMIPNSILSSYSCNGMVTYNLRIMEI